MCGANLILAPDSGIGLTAQQTLAPDGNCKTFDASADGYARGEAVSALYIKRLDHAIRDGNPIRAVIRASGSNADGGTDGFTTPSAEAQELLIRQTYSNANLSLSDTGVVECHGTGTAVGDPLVCFTPLNLTPSLLILIRHIGSSSRCKLLRGQGGLYWLCETESWSRGGCIRDHKSG